MADSLLPGILSGATFGAALTASGVYQPTVIISQLELENWHMMQSFLTATAGSAAIAAILRASNIVKFPPRSPSTLRFFGRFDGNVVGGALLGCGMALSGACPGTVFPQIALGITSGYWALAGGVLGGVVWTGAVRPWMTCRNTSAIADKSAEIKKKDKEAGSGNSSSATAPRQQQQTVYEALGISYGAAFLAAELVLGAAIKAAMVLDAGSPFSATRPVQPVVGGLLIAGSQLVSVLVRGSMLGSSTAFEELGEHVWWLLGGCPSAKRPPRKSLVFMAGMIMGSFALARSAPGLLAGSVANATPGAAVVLPAATAALGGFLMVVGSRMAGGCTSGHGISGMSLLSPFQHHHHYDCPGGRNGTLKALVLSWLVGMLR